MSDIYKLQYGGMTLAYPGWNGYVGYEVPTLQQIRLIGSNSTPVTFNFSNGQSYTVSDIQDIQIPIGTTVTINANSPQGKTFSLQGLDNFTVSDVTWNHKTSSGSFVTANATFTAVNNEPITLGLYNERDKNFRADCIWPASTNQAACSDYQPSIYVDKLSGNMHPNNVWGGDVYETNIENLTTGSKGSVARGGYGSKGWTTYDGSVENVYPVQQVLMRNQTQYWSAHLTMKNITGYAATVDYVIFASTNGSQTRLQQSTYTRGSTLELNFTGNGLNGDDTPYCIENYSNRGYQYASRRPCNHSGTMVMTGVFR